MLFVTLRALETLWKGDPGCCQDKTHIWWTQATLHKNLILKDLKEEKDNYYSSFYTLDLILNVSCAEINPSTLYTLIFPTWKEKLNKSIIYKTFCVSLHTLLSIWAFFLVCVFCCFFSRWICAEWVGPRHHMLVICWWNSHMGAFQRWVTITVHLHRANGYPKPASKQTGPLLFSEKTSSKSVWLSVWKWDFVTCGPFSTSFSKDSLKLFLGVINIKAL